MTSAERTLRRLRAALPTPPTWWPVPGGRWLPMIPLLLLTHPFELVLGLALLANGVRGLVGDPQPSVDALPILVRLVYLAASATAGAGVIVGLIVADRAKRVPARVVFGLAVERAALYMVAVSYAGLAYMVLKVNGNAGVGTATVTVVVALGCFLRTIAIRRTGKIILASLRKRRIEEQQ